VAFTFDVGSRITDNEVALTLSVGDRDLREFAVEKVKIPIQPALAVSAASGGVKASASGALLLGSPDPAARGFGRLNAGQSVGLLGKIGDLDKVDLGGGRFAFVSAKEMEAGGSASGSAAFTDVYAHAPPTLDVKTSAMETKDDKVKITGSASDTDRLLDVYIFVGSRKLYYKSNHDGADPKKAAIEFDAPLRPGANIITIVARETPDVAQGDHRPQGRAERRALEDAEDRRSAQRRRSRPRVIEA
jgi:carboxyl-terminal processing protease